MAKITYTTIEREYNSVPENENYTSADLNLIENYQINKNYDPSTNYIETHFYSLENAKVFSLYDYNISSAVETDAEGNITDFTLEPEKISIANGFAGVDHKIVFHFLNDLYSISSAKQPLYITNISEDRQEVLLHSDKITTSRFITLTENLKAKLNNSNYFEEVWLNLGSNDLFIVTNVDVYELDDKFTVALKLYEPLPEDYGIKSEAQVVEKVSDSCIVEINVDIEEEPEVFPKLAGANFNIELNTSDATPTEYFDFNELFSFSNLNSNREIFSYLNEKSVDINIDYSDYSNFINFSSAQERLKNFKYKVELIQTYQSSRDALDSSPTLVATTSRTKYDKLIEGVINNFDHYDRFLYYESGSNTWPKSTTAKPHTNFHTTSSEAANWYSSQLISASNYDTSNYDVLSNTLPSYLAEDTNNNPAILFVNMIGQHFDNLWIYTKAVTDKYDNDNRLDVGISKDIVRETLISFGAKLYNSVEGSNDLFKYLIADTYDSGSTEELVNTFLQVPAVPSDSQPISRKNYEGEVYKRIYHNLPFLMKTKGTERGLRALINCFGVPSNYLAIKQYGGTTIGSDKFTEFGTGKSSTEKIRVENRISGSVGKVLTRDKSIQKSEVDRVRDTHRLEVGFSPTNSIDTYLLTQLASSFNIDDYIGDPRDSGESSYKELNKLLEGLLINIKRFELNDFIRLLKFYDNVLFKMIKDFVPASSTLDTGIIIKPNLLERSKAKTPQMSGTRPEYSASISIADISGSDGGSYNIQRKGVFIQKELESYWPSKIGGISNFTFKPDFSNRTATNPGEIVVRGTEYYHPDSTVYTFPDTERFGTVYTPYEGSVSSDLDFYLMFSSESIKERFDTAGNNWTHTEQLINAHPHIIPIDYSPHGQNSWVARDNNGNFSASFTPLANDVIIAAATLEAETDLLTYFVNYTKPLNIIKRGEKTTIYKKDIATMSGSAPKWVDDESPKLTGELSGSYIEITDGELNRKNIFKVANPPGLNYDIVPVDEGSANQYNGFSLDVDTFADGTGSCASTFSGVQKYHSGAGTIPAVNDFIFDDINGNTTFGVSSADKWFKIQDGNSLLIKGTAGGGDQGKVLEVADCSKFDEDPPVGYTATWFLSTGTINNSNKASVPFLIYDGELNSTYFVTASVSGNSTEVYATGTVTNSVTQSATIDTTGLPDGSDVLLKLKLKDTSNNTGSFATRKDPTNNASETVANTLTASLKDTVIPTLTSVDFKDSYTFTASALSYSSNVMYVRVDGIPNNERGSVNISISSTGGGTPYTDSQGFNNLPSTTNISTSDFTVIGHNLPDGTLTVTANLTDVAGNTSSNKTDSIVKNVVTGLITGPNIYNSISNVSQNISLPILCTPSTVNYTVSENVNWISISSGGSGTGSGTVVASVSANTTSSTRSATFTLKTGGTTLDTLQIVQSYASTCVGIQTGILMGDGSYKTAGRIVVGDIVRTRQERTLEWMNATVMGKKVFHSKRIKLFIGDKELIVSPEHRLYVDTRSEFIPAQDLKEGDILSGKKFVKIEEYNDGDVVQIGVEKAWTYVTEGILSHNVKNNYYSNNTGDGYGNKIICNELYRQGFLPEEIWNADEQWGERAFLVDPRLVIGYQMWARKVVKFMRKNPKVTPLVYFLCKPWTEWMGYDIGVLPKNNLIGQVTQWFGKHLSYFVFDTYGGQKLLDKYNKSIS